MTALAGAPPAARRISPALLVAWATILGASALPAIVWRAGLGESDTLWIDVAQLVFLALVLAAAYVAEPLRALRPFVAAFAAMAAGSAVLDAAERATGFADWADRAPDYQWVPAGAALLLVPTGLMVLTGLAYGLRREALLLTRGDLRARGRVPGTGIRVRWSRLGPLAALLFVGPLALQLSHVGVPRAHLLVKTLELLPLGLAFAALNALQEEVRFRAIPLALGMPAVGAEAAIWMTAAAFGLGHWWGHPHGPTGVATTFLAGLVLAKAVVETRGLFWAWAIHAALDLVIFVFLVLAS